MFLAILPYRIELDSHWSFDELVKHVQKKCLSIREHSHYPLQHILANSQRNQSNISFLQTAYDLITFSSSVNNYSINDTRLKRVSSQPIYINSKYDFMLIFYYNTTLSSGKLFGHFLCSRDLFDEKTVLTISQRFEHVFKQLFPLNGADVYQKPISKYDIILSREIQEMQDVIFCRQLNILNEGKSIYFLLKLLMFDNLSLINLQHTGALLYL
jgi:non-ribosomal peptide synthetase component F